MILVEFEVLMIPYSYNFVNMRGIDLSKISETDMTGIYSEIVEASNLCGDVVLYNWKFAEIEIAPQHTHIIIGDPLIINGSMLISSLDEISLPGNAPLTTPLEAARNGVYNPPAGVVGYAPVIVSVPSTEPEDWKTNGRILLNLDTSTGMKFLIESVLTSRNSANEWPSSTSLTSLFRELSYSYIANWITNEMFAQYEIFKAPTANIIAGLGLELLVTNLPGETQKTIETSLSDYSAILLVGTYNKAINPNYTSSMIYPNPQVNTSYAAYLHDRNPNYTAYAQFVDEHTISFSGTKSTIIYGIPVN